MANREQRGRAHGRVTPPKNANEARERLKPWSPQSLADLASSERVVMIAIAGHFDHEPTLDEAVATFRQLAADEAERLVREIVANEVPA